MGFGTLFADIFLRHKLKAWEEKNTLYLEIQQLRGGKKVIYDTQTKSHIVLILQSTRNTSPVMLSILLRFGFIDLNKIICGKPACEKVDSENQASALVANRYE